MDGKIGNKTKTESHMSIQQSNEKKLSNLDMFATREF